MNGMKIYWNSQQATDDCYIQALNILYSGPSGVYIFAILHSPFRFNVNINSMLLYSTDEHSTSLNKSSLLLISPMLLMVESLSTSDLKKPYTILLNNHVEGKFLQQIVNSW